MEKIINLTTYIHGTLKTGNWKHEWDKWATQLPHVSGFSIKYSVRETDWFKEGYRSFVFSFKDKLNDKKIITVNEDGYMSASHLLGPVSWTRDYHRHLRFKVLGFPISQVLLLQMRRMYVTKEEQDGLLGYLSAILVNHKGGFIDLFPDINKILQLSPVPDYHEWPKYFNDEAYNDK